MSAPAYLLQLRLPWPTTRDLWAMLPQSAILQRMEVHGDRGREELLPLPLSRGFTHELNLDMERRFLRDGSWLPAVQHATCIIWLDPTEWSADTRRALLSALDGYVRRCPDPDGLLAEALLTIQRALLPRIWHKATQ